MIIKDGDFIKSGKVVVSGNIVNEFIRNPLMAKRFFEKLIILKCEYDSFTGIYTYFCYSHYFKWKEKGKEPPVYEAIFENLYDFHHEVVDYDVIFKKREY